MRAGLNNIISLWFGIIMIVVVVSLAIGIAFTDMLSDRLYGSKRTFFVLLLLAYGVYRGFRIYQLMKQRKYEE